MGRAVTSSSRIAALYKDAESCAVAAGLSYVDVDAPGIRRVRRGGGFAYLRANGRAVSAAERARIQALVIPPAWQNVWVCSDDAGHIQAVGDDDRGRKQYLYHDRWREFREELNFYRLIGFGECLPDIRADIETQLRRRTVDRDHVIATMLRVVDCCGLRAGSDVYAEENDSFGLSTLSRRHVAVKGRTVRFCFPAKSGRQAVAEVDDPQVARVVRQLLEQRRRRLFTVDGDALSADDVNDRLDVLSNSLVTLKDFRTWRGSVMAFRQLRANPGAEDREQVVIEAVDAAAEYLGNTRAVARAHYVHPRVIDAYLDGDLDRFLKRWRGRARNRLDADEAAMLGFLDREVRVWARELDLPSPTRRRPAQAV
jgi:DNA topoisomerase-1